MRGLLTISVLLVVVLIGVGCDPMDKASDHSEAESVPTKLINEVPWVPLVEALAMYNVLPVPGEVGVFSFKQGQLAFSPDKQVFDLLGQKIWMGRACLDLDGKLYIHIRDWETSLFPLFEMPKIFSAEKNLIVIDAGHGGKDTGAISSSLDTTEKDINLDIAIKLKTALAARGWQVALTREKDTYIELAPRVGIAQQFKPDFFISIHVNSAGTDTASGIETFYVTPMGIPSNLTHNYADRIDYHYPANDFDASSYHLAWSVQRFLLIQTLASDRGVKKARFMGVLRNQSCPAILVETGFLSNAKEGVLLAKEEYRQKIATGIARAFPNRKPSPSQSDLVRKSIKLSHSGHKRK